MEPRNRSVAQYHAAFSRGEIQLGADSRGPFPGPWAEVPGSADALSGLDPNEAKSFYLDFPVGGLRVKVSKGAGANYNTVSVDAVRRRLERKR